MRYSYNKVTLALMLERFTWNAIAINLILLILKKQIQGNGAVMDVLTIYFS